MLKAFTVKIKSFYDAQLYGQNKNILLCIFLQVLQLDHDWVEN